MLLFLILLTSCGLKEKESMPVIVQPNFSTVSVHDPSIIKADDTFYIIGSHLSAAKSDDLMQWELISESVRTNTLFEDVYEEFKEEFEYAQSDTFWAGDIQQLKDGRYYMYYCLCKGDSPLSVLGVAVAEDIEGPYKKIESFLYSGTSPQFGKTYDATRHPNVIDPHVFFDNDDQLWMVYGSYSGGIFILELDDTTGLPKDRTTYGTKLLGGNHSRIEAPYIVYNPDLEYYYLFVTFGGLDASGGYNMRVARSKNPDGPYEDIQGQDMIEAKGKANSFFDDASIQPYGNKLLGNFYFEQNDGLTHSGYVSAGHNSVYHDTETNKYYNIFHTRFPNWSERHQVQVNQLYFTEDGWPILSSLNYGGEELYVYSSKQIVGEYSMIETTKEISADTAEPQTIKLKKNGKITGEKTGEWTAAESITTDSIVRIADVTYRGKFVCMWDERQEASVMSFTGVSDNGIPLFLIENKENENNKEK